MKSFLISEDELFGQAVRQVMVRQEVECPNSSMISFEQATRRLSTEPADVIVAVLPDDPVGCIEALDLLAAIPRGERTLIVAIGPAADAKLVIRALRGVVDDYVDHDDMESELGMVLAGWRKKWALDRPEGQLIAVLGPSGGAGSSTIAASLATLLARDLKSTALLDLKLETGDLAALLDLKVNFSIADLCKNLDRLDQVSFERTLLQHPSGLGLLPSPKTLADVQYVTAEGVRQVVAMARALNPAVVVDLDHSFAEEQWNVLRQADVILIVLRLDFTSLKNASRFVEHLDGLGIDLGRVRIVVNRQGHPREIPIAKAEEALKLKVWQTIPDDPKLVNGANNQGRPVVLEAPSSKVSRALVRLALAVQAIPKAPRGQGTDQPDRVSTPGRLTPHSSRASHSMAFSAAKEDPSPVSASSMAVTRRRGEWQA